ncbi:phage portal protein [Pseudooceanicola sediminis]|uniref:Phage portal protein n=1 Tax=Pseudooceanicola sediminis TaxID=2211117 RepID=A0A399J443_9RHOB|nr:phage portal protein [Pseudooceanicola sediminis]KAA2313918.1 phage portal protein [Puniceibacterium sp. HSS470]RII38732.1 phage portal protein [Pseudooceanicola sediminis]|tara:strand:+ start:44476 stop:45540 length:1065 start_codon:yes stop_codon:yes gene_type:complete
MFGWLKSKARPIEQRSSGAGYTAQIMQARESYISGRRGVAELTATVQSCVSLWEGGFAMADVSGTDLLTRQNMPMIARAVALNGEAVFLITDLGLVPVTDWDLTTRNGQPRAYRLSIPEAGGPRSLTALAAEVLHLRIGSDHLTPWIGTAPLRRSSLTGAMLHAVETALTTVFEDAPLGSLIVPLPDSGAGDMEGMRHAFRGRRGSTLIIEGVAQATAAGMNPTIGQKPDQLSPDLSKSMTDETLAAAREGILMAYGVLPALANRATTGPVVREAQRQLAIWTLQPIAALLADEASAKLGAVVEIDTIRPLQAFDAGGRARALSAIVKTMAEAKEAGIAAADVSGAMRMVDWKE